jgi:hypothetical protein
MELLYQAAFLVARVLAVAIGALWGNALWAVAAFSGVSVVFNLVLLIYVLHISKTEHPKISLWQALTTK